MKSVFKWLIIIGGILTVLVIAAALIVPQVVDVKKYKPVIEEKIAQATGRTFSMGDDIDLSVFPWVGVKLTDIRLGSPAGFSQKEMVSVKTFEVRLKVMPLLSRQIKVKTFVLDSPVIYLEKKADGTANWQGMGKSGPDGPRKTDRAEKGSGQGLPIEDLQVDQFSIVNGRLMFQDAAKGVQKQISDFNLDLADISLDKPVQIKFNASLDNQPISIEGFVGPVGKTPGKGVMAIDLALKALNALDVRINGSVTDPAADLQFDTTIEVAQFSPKQLLSALGQPLGLKTKDPKVLETVSFRSRIKGTPASVAISDGRLSLDDSTLAFSASASEFAKPNLAFDLNLDQIDLDRYLPEPAEQKEPAQSGTPEKKKKKKTDYQPLRKLVLDGKVQVGKIKANGARAEAVTIHVKARDGVITVDPFGMKLYQGRADARVDLNVQGQVPKTKVTLDASGIQVGPLLKDAAKKDVIEGTLKADVLLSMQGEDPAMIKKTLNGKGGLLFNDGAIIGIDIAGMVRNTAAKFGSQSSSDERPKTDFAELNIPFTARNGLVKTDGTRMMSPLLRLLATGDIDLVREILDMRIEPKFVATLKGQGDTQQRSGLMVPLLITGNFAKPKIRPDLKGMIGGDKGLSPDALKEQILGTDQEGTKSQESAPREAVRDRIKGLLPGLGN